MYVRVVIICICLSLFTVACGSSTGSSNVLQNDGAGSSTGSTYVPQKDGPCDSADARTTINGGEAICMLNSAGELSWQVASTTQPTNPTPNTPNTPTVMAQVGAACDTPGSTTFVNELYVCKNGKWGYPVPGDLPIPTDGSKPTWYPGLDVAMRQPAATCPASTITFTHSFLPVDQLDASIPYGAMIYDHVTPIDHAYIGIKALQKAQNERTDADYLPITAPADGTIVEVGSLGSPTSHRVIINHGCGVYTVYMVVNRLTGVLASVAAQVANQSYVQLAQPIKAGEEFGQQRDNPLDFNVWASDNWLTGMANPLSYIYYETWKPYTADPSRFFAPEIATALANAMQRTSNPRWGKIDYDVPDSASGNWYLAGTLGYSGHAIETYSNATAPIRGGQVSDKKFYSAGHLAIAPHQVDARKWVFSSGWWDDAAGDPRQAYLVIATGQKTPDQLTSSDSIVVYGLADGGTLDSTGKPWSPTNQMVPLPIGYTLELGQSWGSVALQVNSDGSLSVELFPKEPSKTVTQLSNNKRTYLR